MPLPDPNKIQQQQAVQISAPTKTTRANNLLKQAQEKIEDPSDIGAQLMQAGDNMIQQSYADDAKPDIVDWGASNIPKAAGAIKSAASNFWDNIRNLGKPPAPTPTEPPTADLPMAQRPTDASQVRLKPLSPELKTERDARINAANQALQNQSIVPHQVQGVNAEGARLMQQYAIESNEAGNPELLLTPEQVKSVRVASGTAVPTAPNVSRNRDMRLTHQEVSAQARQRQQEIDDMRRNSMPARNRQEVEEGNERARFERMGEDYARRQGQREIDEREQRRANPQGIGDRLHNFWETMPNPLSAIKGAFTDRRREENPEDMELEEHNPTDPEAPDVMRNLGGLAAEAREIPPEDEDVDVDELEDIRPAGAAAAAGRREDPRRRLQAELERLVPLPPFDFAKSTPEQYRQRLEYLDNRRREYGDTEDLQNEVSATRQAMQRKAEATRLGNIRQGRATQFSRQAMEYLSPDSEQEYLRYPQTLLNLTDGQNLTGMPTDELAAIAQRNYMLSTRGHGYASQITREQALQHANELRRIEQELTRRGEQDTVREALYHATNLAHHRLNRNVGEHVAATDKDLYETMSPDYMRSLSEDPQVERVPFEYAKATPEQLAAKNAEIRRLHSVPDTMTHKEIAQRFAEERENARLQGYDNPLLADMSFSEQVLADERREEEIREAQRNEERRRIIEDSGLFEDTERPDDDSFQQLAGRIAGIQENRRNSAFLAQKQAERSEELARLSRESAGNIQRNRDEIVRQRAARDEEQRRAALRRDAELERQEAARVAREERQRVSRQEAEERVQRQIAERDRKIRERAAFREDRDKDRTPLRFRK
ncbi:hypothetical protein [Candidatus Endomicrobiellum devescovinae]|jgi:hypothetical protein|uniref:hypothetical protein n=1 Tax=Candidatus Endomicrobiellum devescovinae TaxID=3242322 RepID=UPI00282AF141|nr:hypothetical protein [Endomicrobium sp.]